MRTRLLFVLLLQMIPVRGVYAQPAAAPPTMDQLLLARADSITVGDYCRSAERVIAAPTVRTALGESIGDAELSARTICDASMSTVSLRALHHDRAASVRDVARLRTQPTSAAGNRIFDAMHEFRRLVRDDPVRGIVHEALGDSANRAFFTAAETAERLFSRDARDAALRRLDRYERKLGPTSARLNGIEVLLNYGAQRWIPGFAASPSRGPSPLEVVASYVPTYATVAQHRAQAVSASEFGLRSYLFGEQFGKTGWRGLLQPSYWSVGALVVSDRNGALVWPWEGKQRTGAFVSWGTLKAAYVPGRQGALLVSRQLQIIPLAF